MTSETESHPIGKPEDFPDGKPVDVDIETGAGNRSLIVYRRDEEIRAWLNVCPHQGRPLNLAPGRFLLDSEQRLVCAAHGAVFLLADGLCVGGPCKGAGLTTVPLSRIDNHIVAHITL